MPFSRGWMRWRGTDICPSVYDLRIRQAHVFFGRYHHRLRQQDGEWMIAGKKIVLMNELIPTMVDFYCL